MCTYCNNRNIDNEDTLVHALADCQTTQQSLQSIKVTINSPSLQNESRDKFLFLFDLQDKADNMLCNIINKYICDIRGQEKAFFIETFLKKIYLSILEHKNTSRERQFLLKWSHYNILVKPINK